MRWLVLALLLACGGFRPERATVCAGGLPPYHGCACQRAEAERDVATWQGLSCSDGQDGGP